MRCLLLFISILLASTLTAQNTITLKLKIQHAEHGILKKTRMLVNGQLLQSNDSGIVKVTLPKTLSSVKVSLPQSNHVLLFPPGGQLPLPRDLREMPVVIAGDAEDHLQLKHYISLYSLKENVPAEEKEKFQLRLDSARLRLFKLHISESIIQKAEKTADEKAMYISQVISDIIDFRNSLSDFRYLYRFQAADAFEESAALEELIRSVNRYNSSYSKFEKIHARSEEKPLEYWTNANAINEIRTYSGFLVNKVHAPCVYPMQEAVLQIRQYYSGKKKNKSLRKSIEMDTGMFIAAIDKILPELDKRTSKLMVLLADIN
jgi:hypothetical protein